MRRLGVDDSLVQVDPARETGWARVDLDAQGVASYTFAEEPAYDFIDADASLLGALAARPPDAVCFGTLAQRGEVTRRSLMRLLDNVRPREVFYDVNIRRDFYPADVLRASLSRSTVVKINADEAPLVGARLAGAAMPEEELAARLAAEFGVRVLLVTKGPDGCAVHAGGRRADIPGERVVVADTVGAGDAFSAAFLAHHLRTGDPVEAARRGNRLGAYVASKPGAVPECDDTVLASLL
jgi:fructokinase